MSTSSLLLHIAQGMSLKNEAILAEVSTGKQQWTTRLKASDILLHIVIHHLMPWNR
jgi:hypothetical protein